MKRFYARNVRKAFSLVLKSDGVVSVRVVNGVTGEFVWKAYRRFPTRSLKAYVARNSMRLHYPLIFETTR